MAGILDKVKANLRKFMPKGHSRKHFGKSRRRKHGHHRR